jgi:hypothetical protein
LAALRHTRPIPMFTAIASCLLILGTWVGQSGHAKGEAYASSEVQPGSMSNMPGMSMPGMVMPGNPGGDSKASDASTTSGAMPGMDMSTPAGSPSTPEANAMPGMKMDPADPVAGMNIATANMAAMMPGGYHLDCKANTCTLIVSDSATSAIPVLGLHVKLAKLTARAISLSVNGKAVTIKQGRQVKARGVTIRAERISAHESTLRISRAR